jgi:large subunit ribosomal protein L24
MSVACRHAMSCSFARHNEELRAMHVRRDDLVEVITGDDKGTKERRRTARVLRVLPDQGKVVVEGVNRVYKHVRPSRQNMQGGRLAKEMPINASNVLLYCSTCGRGVRIGHRYSEDGAKERFCKRCGNSLGTISPARAAHAKKS